MITDRLELDHVFVCAPRAGEDAAVLSSAGLCCGLNRVHPGQGTANANFYFDNAYLELLWLRDESEVRSEAVAPIALWQRLRWLVTGACPFGVALRTNHATTAKELTSWAYEAPFLPPGSTLPIVTPRGSEAEPLVFLARSAGPPSIYPPEQRVPLEQKGRHRRLSKVHLTTRTGAISAGLSQVIDAGLLSLEAGSSHHMELEFQSDAAGERLDFRPHLPLSIRW